MTLMLMALTPLASSVSMIDFCSAALALAGLRKTNSTPSSSAAFWPPRSTMLQNSWALLLTKQTFGLPELFWHDGKSAAASARPRQLNRRRGFMVRLGCGAARSMKVAGAAHHTTRRRGFPTAAVEKICRGAGAARRSIPDELLLPGPVGVALAQHRAGGVEVVERVTRLLEVAARQHVGRRRRHRHVARVALALEPR